MQKMRHFGHSLTAGKALSTHFVPELAAGEVTNVHNRNKVLAKLLASKGRPIKITKSVRHFTEQNAHGEATLTTEAILWGTWLSPKDAANLAKHIETERNNKS